MSRTITTSGTVGIRLVKPSANPVTVAAGVSIVSSGSYALYGASGIDWSITNKGVLTGGKTGITLSGPGTVANAEGATISGGTEGVALAGTGTVVNSGRISGYGQAGIYLAAGGAVTNDSSGVVIGYSGIQVRGPGIVVNSGFIGTSYGFYDYAIRMDSGTVDNSGLIRADGRSPGAIGISGAGVVTNSGTISADGYSGLVIMGSGTLINQSGATIVSTQYGGRVSIGGFGTLTNNGSMLRVGAYLGSGTFTNTGYIVNNYAGAGLSGDGTLINSGTIFGHDEGVGVGSNVGVTNSGTISCVLQFGKGVELGTGSSLVNSGVIEGYQGVASQGGGITNNVDGIISGYMNSHHAMGAGVFGSGAVTNFGTITAGSRGIVLSSGSVLNGSRSDVAAFVSGVEITSGAAVVTNYGSIGSIALGTAVGGGIVTNAGTIGSTRSGTAIQFGAGSERLIVDPGARFVGSVLGGSGSNVLELASANRSGHISGVGIKFENFGTVVVDAGAYWTFDQRDRLGSGTTVTVGTGADLAVRGSLRIEGAVSFSGPGVVRGAGTIAIDTAAVLTASGKLAAEHVSFLTGGHETLALGDPSGTSGTITGFGQATSNTIELLGAVATSIDYTTLSSSNGILSVVGASGSIASIRFAGGNYSTSRFHFNVSGGSTNITFV